MKRIVLAVGSLLLAIAAQRLVTATGWSAAALVCLLACVLYLIALPRDSEPFPLGRVGGTRRRALLWTGVGLALAACAVGAVAALHFRAIDPEAGGWSLHLASIFLFAAAVVLLDIAIPPPPSASGARRRRDVLWFLGGLAVLLVAAAALRLSELGTQPFGVWYDEAVNALVARDIVAHSDYHPLYLDVTYHTAHFDYLVALAFRWFGDSIQSARLVSAIAGIAMVAAGALTGYELFLTQPALGGPAFGGPVQETHRSYVAPTMSLLLAAILTISAWSLNFSRIAVNYIGTPLFILLAVGFLLRGLRTQRLSFYALAGASVGMGLNFYTSFRLFVPVLPIFLLALAIARRETLRESWRGLVIALLAALIVTAPLVSFAVSNPQTFLERSSDTFLLRDVPSDQRLAKLWENTERHLLMFNVAGDPNGRHNLPGRPMLDPRLAGLFVVGLAACIWRWRRPHSILLLAWFTLTLLGGILTLDFEAPQSLRSNGAIAAAYVIALVPIAEVLRAWEKSQAGRYYPRMAAATAALLIVPIGIWNLTGYYGAQRHDFAVWNSFSTPETITARALAQLDPNQTDAFLISNFYGHPDIDYFAPQWADKAQRIESGDPVPLNWTPGKDAWVFLDADSQALYTLLQNMYPGGAFEEYRLPGSDAVSMRSVHLTPEVLASVEGLLKETYRIDPTAGAAQAAGAVAGFDGDLGEPVATERVPSVDVDWAADSLTSTPSIVEYTGILRVPEYGARELRVEAPGRAALWIDETLILSGTGTLEEAVSLARGNHTIRLRAEPAPGRLTLAWAAPGADYAAIPPENLLVDPVAGGGLLGRFYAGEDWSGDEKLAVVDPQMNIIYHIIPMERPFSVEWTGKIGIPTAGDYTFSGEAIDWMQLFIDGEEVLQTSEPNVTADGRITLSEGLHDIRILYRAIGSHSRVNLWWIPPGGDRSPIPTALLFPPRGSYEGVQIPSFDLLSPAAESDSQPPSPSVATPSDQLSGEIETVYDGLNRPAGVALTPDGHVVVADTGNHQVLLLDEDGALQRTISGGADAFTSPFDVAVDAEGNILVLDPDAPAISVFSSKGEFLRTLTAAPDIAGRARGLDAAEDGRIWVAGTSSQQVIGLNPDGSIATQFPAWEGEDAQIVDVAAESDAIYATVMSLNQLVEYDLEGHRLTAWAIPAANTMDGPHLALGPDGSVFATQPEEGRVARFSASGEPQGYWQLPVDSARVKPVGIAVDGSGHIWITDVEGGKLIRIDPGSNEP